MIWILEPFGCRVLTVTRSGWCVLGAAESYAADTVDRLWSDGDFFVVAAPATAATERMIGVRRLAAMKEGAWIVNVAWGSLVDTDALVEALAADAIGGAALDVTDPGQLADGHPLWAEPRSLITLHSAKPTRRFSPRPGEARRRVRGPIRGGQGTHRGYRRRSGLLMAIYQDRRRA